MFSPHNPSSSSTLSHRHSFGGGEQIGWPPSNHHHQHHQQHHQQQQHPLHHHQQTAGGVKMELQPTQHQQQHQQQANHHQQLQQHARPDAMGVASTAAHLQQQQQHAVVSSQFNMAHHPPAVHPAYPHHPGRASAPALPVFPAGGTAGLQHQHQQHNHNHNHQQQHQQQHHHLHQAPLSGGHAGPTSHNGSALPAVAAHPHSVGAPLSTGGDAVGDARDQRRSTLPLAHSDLELELQIRHNMLIEQQHRIAQLEEELNRSRAEIERLNGKVRLYEQEKAKGAQKKAQSRYWTPEEHQRFLEGVDKYGPKDVKSIALHVGTRNATQVRTHAQKYYLRIDREKKRKEEKESKGDKDGGSKGDDEDGLDDDGDREGEAKAKTSSPDGEGKKRHSEPSPELYKGAVLALLTDWVEEEYDTFVNGVQAFDSETNVQKRLQLVQEKFLPHKTLDELHAINEAIEQQANAKHRRKRMKLSDARLSAADDLFSSDVMNFHRDDLDAFSSGGFAAPYSAGSGEGGVRHGVGAGNLPPSVVQAMNYGRRSSLPAFPVSHTLLAQQAHRHHPLHTSQQHYPQQQHQQQHPQQQHPQQDHSHAHYSSPSAQQQQAQSTLAPPSLPSSDDGTFSSFSQITRHPQPTFAAPLSPVLNNLQGRRMSAPSINMEAEFKQQLVRPRYSMQFDASTSQHSAPHMDSSSVGSHQSSHSGIQQHNTSMPPPAVVERRTSLHPDQAEYHTHQHRRSVDFQQQQQQQQHMGLSQDGGDATTTQRRHSLDLHYQHPLQDDSESGMSQQGQGQGHHDTMGGQQNDSFGHSTMHDGEGLLGGPSQSVEAMSSFGDEGLPHVWSSRILGMPSGEQIPSNSSDDFSLPSESDSASGSASSTDTFGLLSAS